MIKKKRIISLGLITALVLPMVVAVSCGEGATKLASKELTEDKKKIKERIEKLPASINDIDNELPTSKFKLTQIKRSKAIKEREEREKASGGVNKKSGVEQKIGKVGNEDLTEYIEKNSIGAPFFDIGYGWYQFFVPNGARNGSEKDFGKKMLDKLVKQGTHAVRLGFVTNAAEEAIKKQGKKFWMVDWGHNNWHPNPLKQQTVNLVKNHSNELIPAIGGTLPLWTMINTDQAGIIKAENPNDIYSKPGKTDGATYYKFLSEIRKRNMDYIVSIGGYNNNSLAVKAYMTKKTPAQLAESYIKMIELLDLHHIDFDIEGTDDGREIEYLGVKLNPFKNKPEAVKESRELRNNALEIVKKKFPDLRVTYTIPTFRNRVEKFNEEMIKDAISKGVVDEINLMAMDYAEEQQIANNSIVGTGTRPGEMAMYAISAANSIKEILMSTGAFQTEKQAYSHIGVTPMNGVNDVKNEVFYLTDAVILTKWAKRKGIKFISQWSTLRDMRQYIKTERKDLIMGEHTAGMNIFTPDEIHMSSSSRRQDSYSTGLNTDMLAYQEILSKFEQKDSDFTKFRIGNFTRFEFLNGAKMRNGKLTNFGSLDDIFNWNGVLAKLEPIIKKGKKINLGAFYKKDITAEDYEEIYNDEVKRTTLGYI